TPLPGVEITNYNNQSTPHVKTTTDADGRFELHDLAESITGPMIHAAAPGYAPQRIDVSPGTAAAPGDVYVILQPGHSIRGQVVDEHGQPLEGAYLSPRSRAFGSGFGQLTITGADGRFSYNSLPADVRFDVNHEEYGGLGEVEYALDSDDPVTIQFEPPGVIRGRVVAAETGEPVTQFRVRIGFSRDRRPGDARAGYDATWDNPGLTVNSEDGRFIVKPLAAGFAAELEVLAESYDRAIVARAVAAPMAESDELTIRLARSVAVAPFTLSGQLLDHTGRPAAGAQVRLIVSKEPPESAEDDRFNWLLEKNGPLTRQPYVEQFLSSVTDAEGRFEFSDVAPDAFLQLAYWGEGVPQARSIAFDRTKSGQAASVTIELPNPAVVRGTIERANFPDAGEIKLARKHAAWHEYKIKLAPDQTSFEFKDLPPGEYSVYVVSKPIEFTRNGNTGYFHSTIASQEIRLEAGETSDVSFTEPDPPR
ncbi:MAG: carboxypeptidase-like regulatory domain-containing protein, partial [Planctomycetota bacterium]